MNFSQITINNTFGDTAISDAVMPLVPNPSTRFTGRTEIIAKLKEHFSVASTDRGQKRKYFLLHGMGGIGKTQICLKFIEEMSDRYVQSNICLTFLAESLLPPVFLWFSGLMHLLLAPFYRGLRAFASFLKLSLTCWMDHLNLLCTGLAL